MTRFDLLLERLDSSLEPPVTRLDSSLEPPVTRLDSRLKPLLTRLDSRLDFGDSTTSLMFTEHSLIFED